jgi:serine/threonine protein kinase
MEEKGNEQICPKCGFDARSLGETTGPQLPPGTPFAEGKYIVGRVLGIGGFGITYIGYDTRLKTKLAIKEYFPRHIAGRALPDMRVRPHDEKAEQDFRDGLRYFLREAQTAAKFDSHPHVVAVKDYFEEHDTAYIVMAYIEGTSFGGFLEKQSFGRASYKKTIDVMLPILDALGKIHAANLLHRDISPENIYLAKDGTPKLLDFGAARYTFTDQTQSMSLTLKEGYAPIEQYSKNGEQGPWTDIYAVAATIYRALTGKIPPAALERLHEDTLKPPSKLGAIIPAQAEKALLKALSLRIKDRYQDVASFRRDLVATMPKPGLPSLFADWRVVAVAAVALVVVIFGLKLYIDSNPNEKIPEEALRFIGKDADGNPLQPEQALSVDEKKHASSAPRFTKKQHATPVKHAEPKKENRAEPLPAPKAETESAVAPQPQPAQRTEDPSMRNIRKVQDRDTVQFVNASAPKGEPADLFKQGLSLERSGNRRKALEYYESSCEQDYSVACYQAAKIAGDKKLYAMSRALFEKECAAGKGFACTNYGTMLANGEGGKKDIMKARDIFDRSCKLDQAVSCIALAGMWKKGVGSVDDPYLAAKLYKRACELNAKEGCLHYADILASGASGEKEGEKAAKYYYLRACQLGAPAACKKTTK